jgi:hypothetical protein
MAGRSPFKRKSPAPYHPLVRVSWGDRDGSVLRAVLMTEVAPTPVYIELWSIVVGAVVQMHCAIQRAEHVVASTH